MPAAGHTGHWKKVDQDDSLLFARGQAVVLPSGRKATLTMYWTSELHEYVGCASIKYCDNNETAIISLSLLKQWQPGVTYAPPPLRQFSQTSPVSPSEVSTPTNAPKQRRKRTMKPTPTAPATRVAHINDVPAVVTARDFYNDVTTQLENASELLSALQSSYASAAKPTPDKLADELLKRAEALLAGEAVPKSDQERLNLLALKVDTLSKAKPEAFKKYERARSLASANYCAGEIPDMLARKKQQLDLLQKLHTLNGIDITATRDVEKRGFELAGGLQEVRYREEFLPIEIAELKKEIETLEDRFTDFSGQTTSVVFLTPFNGYAGLHAAVREVRDLPTELARQLIREGSIEPATAVHVSNWQRLLAKKAAQAQVAFS